MNYVALYRKYRPQTFDQVIGQNHIINTLKNQIVSGKISHAYLFTGTRGTGKTSTAKIFARAINCIDNKDGNPCLKCSVCTEMEHGVDVIEMDAASNNGVDYARDIREKVQYPPIAGKYKVYIIDEVHMLTQSAFNALLKTLEEPPKHVVFILCTTEVHKIPATIVSRCMRFDFKLVSTPVLAKHVAWVYDQEGKKYTADAVNAIALAGEGSVRDSLSIADRCFSIGDGELTYDQVTAVLGASSRDGIIRLAGSVLQNDVGAILEKVEELVSSGKDVARLNKDLSQIIHDILIAKTCKNAREILCLPEDAFAEIKKLAESSSQEKLLYAIDSFARLEGDLRFSLSPLVLFEAVLLRVSSSTGEVDVGGLDRRLSRLEQQPQNVNADSLVVIDRTNYQSVWSGVKVQIDKANKPVLSALWREIDAKLESGCFVATCTKAQYYMMEQYADFMQELFHDKVKMNFVFNMKDEGKSEMQQINEMGKNVVFVDDNKNKKE